MAGESNEEVTTTFPLSAMNKDERHGYTEGYKQAMKDIECGHGCGDPMCPTRRKAAGLIRRLYERLALLGVLVLALLMTNCGGSSEDNEGSAFCTAAGYDKFEPSTYSTRAGEICETQEGAGGLCCHERPPVRPSGCLALGFQAQLPYEGIPACDYGIVACNGMPNLEACAWYGPSHLEDIVSDPERYPGYDDIFCCSAI